jgi:iron complex outermembrane recepter protein
VNSFEVGTKSEMLNHHLRLNGDVFYMIQKDPQENIQTVSSSTVEFYSGPEIKRYGVEIDAAYIPVEGLTVNFGLNYLHGEQAPSTSPFVDPYTGGGTVEVENKLQAMPKFTGSLGILYDVLRTSYGVYRLDADANMTTSYYSVPNVTLAVAGYTLFNGRASLAEIPVGRGLFDVSLWGKNLGNKDYRTFIYAAPATAQLNPTLPGTTTAASFGQPRTYGISVNFKY